jgi:hypothetical protein
MLNPDNFIHAEKLFLKHNNMTGSAGQLFRRNLSKVLLPHYDEIRAYARPERVKKHSPWKGSSTYVTSATMEPLPLPSVCSRGEWSQGPVFDVYFQFAFPGDHYLGCVGRSKFQ